jgi:glycosyltransferase involved in cell wall biosynthesis
VYVLARNEAANIVQCLAPLRDVFDDIVVVDDASTDGTGDIVASQLGIRPLRLDSAHFPCKAAVRNFAVAHTRQPWVLKLDADERLSTGEARRLLALPDAPPCDGFFCAWLTSTDDGSIEDYKLPLARRECVESGLAHENLQQQIRRRGALALWLDDVRLLHFPDAALAAKKRIERRARLLAALEVEPRWYRHHWFLGYMDFLDADFAAARSRLGELRAARPREFPVECVNAMMVLAEIEARHGDAGAATGVLREAATFLAEVRDDFEVRVNFRAASWIDKALRDVQEGRLDAVRTYAFSR